MLRILLALIILDTLIGGILLWLGLSFYTALIGSLLINCLLGMAVVLTTTAFSKQVSLKDSVNRRRKN
ncbi:MAG: hypothetical protein AAB885_02455 [Patescibacteria group bacterium]